MKIVKLGENLYEVKLPFWYWTSRKYLVSAILEIQGYGKSITSIRYGGNFPRVSYLIVTM